MKNWQARHSWALAFLVVFLAWEIAVLAGYKPYDCASAGEPANCTEDYKAAFLYPFALANDFAETYEKAILAFGTMVLAAFTFALWWSTYGLWRVTADAAERNERNQVRLERPQMYALVTAVGLREQDARLHISDHFRLEITNFGRTVAEVTEIRVLYPVLDHDGLPPTVDPAIREGAGYRLLPVGEFSAPSFPVGEIKNWREALSQDYLKPGSAAAMRVWFVGWVRYTDIFGNRYLLGFCRKFDPAGRNFVRQGGERYNYARED